MILFLLSHDLCVLCNKPNCYDIFPFLETMTDNLYQKIYDTYALVEAWEKIRKKGSRGGIDDVGITDFQKNLDDNIKKLSDSLQDGSYVPEPYQEFKIDKGNNEFRTLGLPTIRDKIVQQAVLAILEPILNPAFLDISYAYRPNKGPLRAVNRVKHIMANENRSWVLLCDIDNFFDTIDHSLLFEELRKYVHDEQLLRLISLWIKMGKVTYSLVWKDSPRGIPQGAIISPLLSNLYLNPLDQHVVDMGYGYVRYADNFIVLCSEETEALEALKRLTAFLSGRLKLSLNPESIVRNVSLEFVFLGVTFKNKALTISESKAAEIKDTLKEAIPCGCRDFKKLEETLSGLKQYYGQFLPEETLKEIDAAAVRALKDNLRERYRAGEFQAKKEMATLLTPLQFLSHEFTLYRGRVVKEILAYCRRERRCIEGQKKPQGDPIQKKKRHYEMLQIQSSVLMVTKAGTFLGINKNGVVVKDKGRKIHQVPLKRLKTVIVKAAGVGISSNLISSCADNGVDMEFLISGKHTAKLVPFQEQRAELWVAQLEALRDLRGEHLARAFVKGKIKNQRNLILYFSKYHTRRDAAFADMLKKEISLVEKMIEEISQYKDVPLETLRGKLFSIEGRASSIYWDVVKLLLGKEISFEGRVKKGAEDLVNSLLNYGYGILYGRISRALMTEGLSQYIGYLHKSGSGRPVLVFDLIEEFRQQMVDRVVFGMLRKGASLSLKDGRLCDETKTRLTKKIFERIYAYEYCKGKRIRGDEIMRQQAKEIACYLLGKAKRYRPYVRKW